MEHAEQLIVIQSCQKDNEKNDVSKGHNLKVFN